MSTKDKLIKNLEAQITAWEKEAEAKQAEAEKKQARAENEKAGAALKEEFTEKIRSLQSDIEAAKEKLKEIKSAGEDRMADLKRQVSDWLG